jgi:hypothetical protein
MKSFPAKAQRRKTPLIKKPINKFFGFVYIGTVSFFIINILSCSKPQEETLFTLLPSNQTGIDFRNDLISNTEMNILEYLYFYNGGGVALGDINNDGLVDIYFTSNQGENKLYLNKGNFEFEDITLSAKVTGDGGWSTGVTMADVNGDGLLDIYVCQVGDYKGINGINKLYINNGDLTFSEKAAEYGIDFVGFSTHAVFFDYDQDGDLDLYLLNHSIKKPEVFSHADTKFTNQDEKGGDKLYKSLVSEGEERMVEVTAEAGILSSSLGFGLGVGIADVNGDGWLDIYVSNDFTEDDYLYINQADGTFKESLKDFIENTSRYSMGNDIGDINNDGLPDIFTTDMLPEDPVIWMKSVGEDKQEVYDIKQKLGYGDQYVRNHLQLNRGDGRFSEIGLLTETFATDWSWSPLIFDMDNDGKKDIHVTNGIVKRPNDLDFVQYSQEPAPGLSDLEKEKRQVEMLPTVKLSNFTFKNEGELKFTNASKLWGLDQLSYSNGSAYADLDNDGDLDLVINNTDQEAFIYRNNSSEKTNNHFVQLDLRSTGKNIFGIGAQVWVFSDGEIYFQTLSTSRGFQSGTSTTLTFGLGNSNQIDSVLVSWNSMETEVFENVAVGQKSLLEKGKGRSTVMPNRNFEPVLAIADIDLDWKHEEKSIIDEFRREYLMPRRYGTEGPALAVGDVNGDGLEDIFLGGANGQPGALFFQNKSGGFDKIENPFFEQLKTAEDVVAVFEDFNQDGHLDLYIGSGGNEYAKGEIYNFDRIFLNDGKGNLIFSMNSLPPFGENTSTIAVHDFNGDGYPDIFVGASVVTGNYGAIPRSYLLLNDGKGKFQDATTSYFGDDFRPGMVQNAIWADITGNGIKELVLSGEWMPVLVYSLNDQQQFEKLNTSGLELEGWYFGMSVIDVDGNGLQDIVLGNLGLNSKLKASQEQPVWLYHHDFDGNGQTDPLIFHYMDGKLVPFAGRDDLIKQIPALKRRHDSYISYSTIKSPKDLFDGNQLEQAKKYQAKEFRSGVLRNLERGGFEFEPFPIEAQFSPIKDFRSFKGKDGNQYVLGVGNFYGFRNDLGKNGSQPFTLLKLDGGNWVNIPIGISANDYWGEYRRVEFIKIGGIPHLVAVRNNGTPVFLKIHP